MAISIGSNLVALQAQRRLDITGSKLSNSFNRLSSGYRINRGSDDSAGLAIAETLKADARIAQQSIRNTNDGISTIAIADGALGEVASILSRLAELASQAANGTLSNTQRSVIATEFVALGSEIQRISDVTEFNGIKLLSGNSAITIQVGPGTRSGSQIGYNNQVVTSNDAATAARLALDAVYSAIYSVGASRGVLGGVESRLSTAIINLGVARENQLAAESRIRDVDIAEESAVLTRLNILQQAGTAVLAQGNQLPALALQLLR